MKTSGKFVLASSIGAVTLAASTTFALAEQASLSISIKDHHFQPAEIHAPANTLITLVVRNLDSTPEEFESKTLRVEKLVAGNGTITMQIRPLAIGRYRFFGDYHEDTAEGYLVIE
ncbi:cupredoxin domain-containing protein [Methylosinus sp. PW1]|uniref:cupredoxin domain-containing protein n=1 Tax=Methylosinus sp. PW1 TaxID=107636 RepID=UPI000569A339|nr:cupredoxin domain-containing protein [Methylosinus sp. PW1]